MKTGTAVAIGLILLGAVAGGLWLWRHWDTIGEASEPPAAFSSTDRRFINTTYSFLDSQAKADEDAARWAHFPSVKEFAKTAAADHNRSIEDLKRAVSQVEPNFSFEPIDVPAATPNGTSGAAYDRAYLDSFIHGHQEQAETLAQLPFPEGSPSLDRFVSLWRPAVNRHLSQARAARNGLPSVASNVHVLLLAGVLCAGAALVLEICRRRRGRQLTW